MTTAQPTDREIAELFVYRYVALEYRKQGLIAFNQAISDAKAKTERETVERCAREADRRVEVWKKANGVLAATAVVGICQNIAIAIRDLSPPSPKDQPE